MEQIDSLVLLSRIGDLAQGRAFANVSQRVENYLRMLSEMLSEPSCREM